MRGLLRIHEIAKRKDCSASLVHQLAMRPDFPPVEMRIGRAVFYHVSAIDTYWEMRKDRRRKEHRRKRRPK